MNTLQICKHCSRVKINGKWMRFFFSGGPVEEIQFVSVECDPCARIYERIALIPKEAV